MKEIIKKDKVCFSCGAVLKNVPCNVKYCEKCREISKQKSVMKFAAKKRGTEIKVIKQDNRNFLDVVRAADAAGMSYGKYCLKYGI